MQFLFVEYHYFHAVQVYNPIRIFVSSYVWMTGFGNFSFFYIKRDFSLVRVLQVRVLPLLLLRLLLRGESVDSLPLLLPPCR